MKRFLFSFLLIVAFLASGCATYHVLRPLNPSVGNPNFNPRPVSSIQPDISWGASTEPGTTYDLIIYECIKEVSFWKGTKRSVGEQVYYRENITGNYHKVEIQLKPDTEYYWAVRIRKGDEKSEWSSYDYTLFLVLSYMKVGDALYRFRTPLSDK